MVRHIIMFRFLDVQNENSRLAKINQMKNSFYPLRNIINVVESYEVAINQKKTEFSYDLALISEFISWDNLETYLKHPEHQKAIESCKNIRKEKAIVDYEF